MAVYAVEYRMSQWADSNVEYVSAKSKADAYDKVVYEILPEKHACTPYSAWVSSVTYNNGNYRVFNTCEGLAY